MRQRKITFVTVLIALMLLVIDAGLYKLWTPGFLSLTGLLAVYGYIRASVDFRGWLVKEEPYTPIELTHKATAFDWQKEEAKDAASETAASMTHVNSGFLDALLEEAKSYHAEAADGD